MSRAQENQTFDTAADQNKQFNENAQTSYTKAQGDVGDYEAQLGKYAAANPFKEGGEYQTDTNKVLANTADANAQAAGQLVQGAAVRGGENANSAISATEAMQEANERAMAGQQADAEGKRIGAEADYNKSVLGANEFPVQAETSLTGTEAGQGNESLGTQQKAGMQPSFLDTLGQSFAEGLGGAAGKAAGGGSYGKFAACWIAAELWGGWADPRTILVRVWLQTEFRRRWYGPAVLWLYSRYGERLAKRIKTDLWLRAQFAELFERALNVADKWIEQVHGGHMTRAEAARFLKEAYEQR
jgi:hypothetical protein